MRATLYIAALTQLVSAGPAVAAGLAYVRASSQYQVEASRGRYHPLNLLDEDPNTAWCGNPGRDGESVQILFKTKQRIDRIVVNATTKTGRVVEAVRVSDGMSSVVVPVGAEGSTQTLTRPLEGSTYEITIEKVGGQNPGGASPEVACLGDALLYFRNALFGAAELPEKLRYDERLDKLLGRWAGGALGAPESSLVFSLDGSWEWAYTPLMGGRSKKKLGEYRFRGNRLLMREGEAGRWTDMQFKWQRMKVNADDMGAPQGDYDKITLGVGLGVDLTGDYNNALF